MKSTWSPGPISHTQASLSHELWKVSPGTRNSSAPSRPPPGLTNTRPESQNTRTSSTWGGNSLGLSQGWTSSYSSGKSSVHQSFLGQSRKTSYLWGASVVWSEQSPPLSVWSCVFRAEIKTFVENMLSCNVFSRLIFSFYYRRGNLEHWQSQQRKQLAGAEKPHSSGA